MQRNWFFGIGDFYLLKIAERNRIRPQKWIVHLKEWPNNKFTMCIGIQKAGCFCFAKTNGQANNSYCHIVLGSHEKKRQFVSSQNNYLFSIRKTMEFRMKQIVKKCFGIRYKANERPIIRT